MNTSASQHPVRHLAILALGQEGMNPDDIVKQYGKLKGRAAIYSGTIDNTDRAIGRLVAKLEKLGELDNTIISYSSDNGSYRQDRCGKLRGKKGSHFEGGHRVPGIFYWKGRIPGGRVVDEPAGAIDLLPTVCGLLGIDKPEGVHLDGSDLTPLLTRTGAFAAFASHPSSHSSSQSQK